METIDRELFLKEYRIAWFIWIAMVFSLCIYLLICRYMDNALRQSMDNIEVLRTALFAVSFVVLGTAFFLRRRMLKVPHFSLPNLLAGREVVQEFFQNDVAPEKLGPALFAYLDDPQRAHALQETFAEIHYRLRKDASRQAAAAVLELIGLEAMVS